MTLLVPSGSAPNLVQDKRLDIATDGTGLVAAGYTFTQAFGLKTLTDSNSYTSVDTTTFDTGARGTDLNTQYKKAISGTFNEFRATDPVHALLKAAGEAISVRVAGRYYSKSGAADAKFFIASCQWEPQGGGSTDIRTNNFTLMIQDVWTDITNPVAVASVISSALPTAAQTGEWIEVLGTGFAQGITSVTVGGVSTTWLVINDGNVHVKVPAGTAGSAPVVVTTAAGASNSQAYTRG